MKLLTVGGNPKTDKSVKYGYLTGILHLAPYNLSGTNVCQHASPGCIEACLNTAGRGGIIKKGETTNVIQKARIARTRLLFDDKYVFQSQLTKEILSLEHKANKMGLLPAVRLNGTSDLPWHKIFPALFWRFQNIQFYDYTKDIDRMFEDKFHNYDLTLSRSETNAVSLSEDELYGRVRIAIVGVGKMPYSFNDVKVVSGDDHDLRFLDPKDCVVWLKAKGKATRDTSGFVISQRNWMELG